MRHWLRKGKYSWWIGYERAGNEHQNREAELFPWKFLSVYSFCCVKIEMLLFYIVHKPNLPVSSIDELSKSGDYFPFIQHGTVHHSLYQVSQNRIRCILLRLFKSNGVFAECKTPEREKLIFGPMTSLANVFSYLDFFESLKATQKDKGAHIREFLLTGQYVRCVRSTVESHTNEWAGQPVPQWQLRRMRRHLDHQEKLGKNR